METEYESSRIERAKRGLYSTGDKGKEKAEHYAELSPSDVEVANDWQDTSIVKERPAKKTGGIKILKMLTVLAVLTAIGSGGYLLYQVSGFGIQATDKNILITFDVPVGATPGVPADILVRINNQNRVALDYANLTLIYPSGVRRGDDPDQDLRDEKKVLGTIAAGQVAEYRTKAIFLGEENTEKELRANLEYRFANINSVFTKVETRSVHILASPVNLTVDALKEVNAGQNIELNLTAVSNTIIPLRDVLVKVEYPLGFTYLDADPKPAFSNNIWRIGRLDPTGKFKLKIHGILSGEATQEKVFHTSLGAGSDQTARDVSVLYGSVLSSMTIQRPFIGIGLLLNGKSADQAVAHFGERIIGLVSWKNNLSTKIVNAQIEVKLSGIALARETVLTQSGGFFRSSDNTILWDERGAPELAEVEAGGEGGVDFSFLPMPSISGGQLLTQPTIIAEVTVRGRRISESGVPEEVKTVMTEEVKITSQAQFAARAVHFSGPFVNSGPMPPRVEQETTYTVIWNIVNISNTISNPQVRATIPPYVTWSGSVSPTRENISYNPTTHQIIWMPGDIPPGTGVGSKPPKEVAFQLVFTPSLTQVKTAPVILNNITFDATDAFTGESLSQSKDNINTILTSDPKAGPETSQVVP